MMANIGKYQVFPNGLASWNAQLTAPYLEELEVTTQATGTFTIPVQAGQGYLIQRTSAPTTSLPFAAVSGSQATSPKTLNGRSIGLS